MLLLYYFGDLFARWLARRRGQTLDEVALGFGDVNLSGVLGLMLGWPGIIVGLILAIFLGGIFSLLYLLGKIITRRYRTFMAIPYGPFLVASAILLLFFAPSIQGLF
jgi:leader peptidase (prepilin peptidase)/N-methyltransferase